MIALLIITLLALILSVVELVISRNEIKLLIKQMDARKELVAALQAQCDLQKELLDKLIIK